MRHPLAGKPAPKENLVDVAKLIGEYFYYTKELLPIKFGTSGHRGSAKKKSFNENHVLSISQAIVEYKNEFKIDGPLFIGIDTHALSTPAQMSTITVFAANGVEFFISELPTPTPLVSFAILEHNKTNRKSSDGIVLTPSHNPPEDGGYKYNPPEGGPAQTDVTKAIETKANEILKDESYKKIEYEEAIKKAKRHDFITPYVEALHSIVDMDAIAKSNLKLIADPLGGSAIGVYKAIKERYLPDLEIRHDWIDYTFSFMTLDHDGKIRMDCSSPYAMASLLHDKKPFDLAFANDTDADRHGIVTPEGGLMNPNHFLSVAIWYLFNHRDWPKHLKIGKTFVSSSMIDRVAKALGVEVYETPVGFKWFAKGLYESWLGFAGEESAGASFLRKDATTWTTDKDGIVMAMLAAEIKAKLKDPALVYKDLEAQFGQSYYERIDIPANEELRQKIKNIDPKKLHLKTLAGEPIENIFTQINGMDLGGVKIVTPNGWIALRPSGTEDIYKIYAESFISKEHLKELQNEAQGIVKELI